VNTRLPILKTACLLLLVISAGGCKEKDNGVSALVCELEGQCLVAYRDGMFAHNYDDFKGWCECEVPSDDDTGPCYNGSFHTGSCDQGTVLAYCDASQDRSRYYYDDLPSQGVIINTHALVVDLHRVCSQLDNGSFTLVTPNLCSSDSDCDNGITCDGAERCVMEEECSFNFCTQASCKPATEPYCPEGQFCNPGADICE
jgi:hypothetical protein